MKYYYQVNPGTSEDTSSDLKLGSERLILMGTDEVSKLTVDYNYHFLPNDLASHHCEHMYVQFKY